MPPPGQPQAPKLQMQTPLNSVPPATRLSNEPEGRGTLSGDQAERQRLLSTGAGVTQIAPKIEGSQFGQNHPLLGKIAGIGAEGLGMLGDVALNATGLGRTLEPLIPGTLGHHQLDLARANNAVGQDEKQAQEEAATRETNSLPQLHQAQAELAGEKLNEKTTNDQAKIDEQLRAHGFKSDEKGNVVPLSYQEMSEPQQAVYDLKGSQEELAEANKQLKDAQSDPNSIQYKLAQQRIEGAQQARAIALRRLGFSEQTYDARYRGTDAQGQALPGAMLTEDNRPVGSSFSQNVRPTGTERNKADMAGSAKEQLTDIASIVAKHPTLFGPGYGQSSAFRQWIGSQDPDAQRFVAARTIAGDHLAGTFGGRSEAALDALDTAIGKFKDNPNALKAGLDQLSKANERFLKAGTVKTAGSNAAAAQPKENDTKKNSAGDELVYKGGKWQIQSK